MLLITVLPIKIKAAVTIILVVTAAYHAVLIVLTSTGPGYYTGHIVLSAVVEPILSGATIIFKVVVTAALHFKVDPARNTKP